MNLLYRAISSYIDFKINRECLVSWIDPNGVFSTFINRLDSEIITDKKKYKLIQFKGSFLESILELHKVMQDVKKPDCLVYIPYIPLNELEKTPFLEVLKSSDQIASDPKQLLEKISSGYLSPDQLTKCISSLPATYEQLESILSGDDLDLSIFNNPASVLEFTKALLSGNNTILDNIEHHPKGTLLQLQKGFEKTFGFIPSLMEEILDQRTLISAKEKEDHSIYRLPLSFFLLGREYVNDLINCRPSSKHLIQMQEQGLNYLDAIRNVLKELRQQYPDSYKTLAIEIEELGIFDLEKQKRTSKELGNIDTLYFEDTLHQVEVVRLIEIHYYKEALSLAKGRSDSFWKKNDPNVEQFWNWAELTSSLAQMMQETSKSFQNVKNLENVLDVYQSDLYRIDREYRSFCRATEMLMQSPSQRHFGISLIRKQIWKEYSEWIESTNQHYQAICEKNGFL
ncbi:hypothetical protein, partial [Leptospira bouyouniensis]